MFRIDYHSHTQYSYDCESSLIEILHNCAQRELDAICITDHDTIEGALKLKGMVTPGLEIIVGCEFTTEDGSHIIGIDLKKMISEKNSFRIIEEIKKQEGFVLLPHIFRRGSGIFRNEMKRSPKYIQQILQFVDGVECFNGRDSYENNLRSYEFVRDNNLPSIAGSDAHSPKEIGSVYVSYSKNAFIHGQSKRNILFPIQVPCIENPLKRRLMEFYHFRKKHLPAFVQNAYRQAKKMKRSNSTRRNLEPQLQYEFEELNQTMDAHEE